MTIAPPSPVDASTGRTRVRIEVTVTPRARRDEVKSGPDGGYVVSVRAPAREGKANQAVLSALARYFSVPKSALRIVRGETARHKVIQIDALPGWGTREARRSAAIHGSGQKS